ncbi:MAG: hypothetical protein KZQ96_08165 [Candidatus Thiodiazotropha sp. (ex Lucinoma borealis)]|nr:hypothetical protein [Candidatus Thiodiazotropha sp. (ex Lucinoma borealis)]
MQNQELYEDTVVDMARWNVELNDDLMNIAKTQAMAVVSQYPDLEDLDSWGHIMGTLPDKLEEKLKCHLGQPDYHKMFGGTIFEDEIEDFQKETPLVDWHTLPEELNNRVWHSLANQALDATEELWEKVTPAYPTTEAK